VEFDRPYLGRQPVDTECLYPASGTVAGGWQGLAACGPFPARIRIFR